MLSSMNLIKKLSFVTLALISISRGAFAGPNTKIIKSTDIEGVWNLTKFQLDDAQGNIKDWCDGAFGSIVYYQGHMSVAINCKSNSEKMVFYSGPYEIEGDTVIHKVQNFSDISLKQNFRRKVEIPDADHLNLVGPFGQGGKAVLSWERRERFDSTLKTSNDLIAGVYSLKLSENQFEGKTGVPFCTGVYGTILYTPGGYVTVSLNCAPNADESQAEPADVFGRKYFYAGHYTLENDQALHMPENGSVFEHIGHLQTRTLKIENGELSLTGFNGSSFVAVWKKITNSLVRD